MNNIDLGDEMAVMIVLVNLLLGLAAFLGAFSIGMVNLAQGLIREA